MKPFIVFIFFLLTASSIEAQQIPSSLLPDFLDYGACPNTSNSSSQQVISSGSCLPVYDIGKSLASKFIPTSTQPILYVRLNLIFLQRTDGTGNFQENNPEHMSIINDAIVDLNRIYASFVNPNVPSCFSGSNFVSDSRIQFVVANKIFVKDNYGWNNCHDKHTFKCPYNPWYLDYLDNQIISNPNISRGINIYFTEDSIKYRRYVEFKDTTFYGDGHACSLQPYYNTSKIHEPDKYTKYLSMKNDVPAAYNQPWIPVVRYWMVNSLSCQLGHEIGHSFGFDDVYPPNSCNTLMNLASGDVGGAHNFLSPTEIGSIYAALSFTNLRNFVPSDAYIGVKDISTIETWYNMRLYSGLNITSPGNMTFPCNMTMPYQANIQVSGILTVDDGIIKSIQNDWGGITVKSGGLLVLNGTTISDYNITVEAGGSLIIKGSLVMSGNHAITVQSGGYLCVETGTTMQLTDYNSVIKIGEGSFNGVNPALNVSSSCISNPSAIIPSGNGAIADFNQDVYIQNQTISASRYIGGKNIYVGNHVTTGQTAGDVKINNGANVIFDAKNITFDAGFECVQGSSYEVKNH